MPKASKTRSHSKSIIEVEDLSVSYYGRSVFKDVSFKIEPGEIVAILGPNGSGKSTLMKTILGLIKQNHGKVRIHGKRVSESYGTIGYVPQRYQPHPHIPMTVREFINLARPHRTPPSRIKEVLAEVGLHPVNIAKKQLAELSGGQLQRVLIARAILNDPDILFLDEPASGIDVAGEQTLFEILKHLNKDHNTTIMMISHEVNMIAKHVTHVICLNERLICAGPPSKALKKSVIKELYGEHYEHHDH